MDTKIIMETVNNQQNQVQQESPGHRLNYTDAMRLAARKYLINLLIETNGSVTEVAKIAERNRTQMYRFLRRLNIDPKDFRVFKKYSELQHLNKAEQFEVG